MMKSKDRELGHPEGVDTVAGDEVTTMFKRAARKQQSQWRNMRRYPAGTQPVRPKDGETGRSLGSRIEIEYAYRTGANFITEAARNAADERVRNKEPHQTLNVDRLYGDLLSSMPMCFNLFGLLHADLELADRAVHTWWSDTPGKVTAVRFEWSPGRSIEGSYLGNRSAFDVAFELDLGGGRSGVIGVETKYHEHCKAEQKPGDKRLPRYRAVTEASGVFRSGAIDEIIGTKLQQIWLDHLLALSMPQTDADRWTWVRFVLVHPARNPSFAGATQEYRRLLANDATFVVNTIESLLNTGVFPAAFVSKFRERYI